MFIVSSEKKEPKCCNPSYRRLPSRAASLCPTLHCPLVIHVAIQAPQHVPPFKKRFTLSLPAGTTIMSTTYTPSLSRSHSLSTSCSQCTNVLRATPLCFHSLATFLTDPSALLTLVTWNVPFLSCAPAAVDMISVFSPSFSTLPPLCSILLARTLLIPLSCGLGKPMSTARLSRQHYCQPLAAVAWAPTCWASRTTVHVRLNCLTESSTHKVCVIFVISNSFPSAFV